MLKMAGHTVALRTRQREFVLSGEYPTENSMSRLVTALSLTKEDPAFSLDVQGRSPKRFHSKRRIQMDAKMKCYLERQSEEEKAQAAGTQALEFPLQGNVKHQHQWG